MTVSLSRRFAFQPFAASLSTVLLSSILVACSSGSSQEDATTDNANDNNTGNPIAEQEALIQGTAAIGAPLANVPVVASCQDGSGFNAEVQTDAQGRFNGRVASEALPCALYAVSDVYSSGIHSLAFSAGTTNITPITDMTIALAVAEQPSVWFQSIDWNSTLASDIEQAQTRLLEALEQQGFDLPSASYDAFTTPFNIGDAFDRLLDALDEALSQAPNIADYAELLSLVAGGSINTLPSAPVVEPGEPSEPSVAASARCFNPALFTAGTRVNTVHKIPANGSNAPAGVRSIIEKQDLEVIGYIQQGGDQVVAQQLDVQTGYSFGSPLIPVDYLPLENQFLYLKPDLQRKQYQIASQTDSAGAQITFTPSGPSMRFNLNEGESFQERYTMSTGGRQIEANRTVTFIGLDTIAVPAGRFETCRFDEVTRTSSGSLGTRTVTASNWIMADTGVVAQSLINGNAIRQLESLSINGTDY